MLHHVAADQGSGATKTGFAMHGQCTIRVLADLRSEQGDAEEMSIFFAGAVKPSSNIFEWTNNPLSNKKL